MDWGKSRPLKHLYPDALPSDELHSGAFHLGVSQELVCGSGVSHELDCGVGTAKVEDNKKG